MRRRAPCFEATLWLGNMAPAWDRQGAIPMTMIPTELDAFLLQDIEKSAGGEVFAGAISQ